MRLGHTASGALAIVLATWMCCGIAAAATITVSTTLDELTTNGQCSLREAIAAVNTPGTLGDCAMADGISNTIVLGPHSYGLTIHPTGGDDQTTGDLDVTVSTPLTIKGAGAGATAISGTTLQDRILHVLAGGSVTINGLTITGGHAPDGANGANGQTSPVMVTPTAGVPGAPGGGIRNEGALTLRNVAVTKNTAGSGGMGGFGQPDTAAQSPGQNGGAGGAGGGIYNDSPGSLTLANVTVSGNVAGNGGTGGAGGQSSHTVLGGPGGNGGCCGDGGGLDNVNGQLTITGSTFSGNHAGNGGSGGPGEAPNSGIGGAGGQGQGGSSGGAIATSGASATVSITNSTLTGNFSGVGGNGGHGGNTNETPIQNYQSGGNAGNGSAGGGIFISAGATATLSAVTVAGNQVGGPGTPGAAGSTPSCSGPNCGVPQPGAPGNPAFGGGVYDSTTPATTLTNTLLASNELGNCAGNITDGGHNLSFGDSNCPGTGFNQGDPKLGPLQNNGGPTQTLDLRQGSAAFAQIPSAQCLASDQRGVSRPAGPNCDIGAYEKEPPAVSTNPAGNLTPTTARLSGRATANAGSAAVQFEYGTTSHYGTRTAVRHVSGLTAVAVQASLTGLKPGTTYHYALIATTLDGTTVSTDRTFATHAQPRPRISHLKLKPGSFPPTGGATLRFTDSEAGTVRLVIRRCVKADAKTKRCTKYRTLGSLAHSARAGTNRIHLAGKLHGKALRSGHYQLKVTPIAAGQRGNTLRPLFRVT